MSKKHIYLLSSLSGLLLSLAWPANGFPFLLFIAIIPLLIIEDDYFNNAINYNKYHIIIPTWLAFFIWNGLTTFWVMNSTLFGGIMAVLLNSFLMAFVFMVYHIVRRTIKHKNGQFLLLFLWLAWEYFHLDWDLSWPWLTLGNAFASYPSVIQWYEYTGVAGGSLWIITINILLFRIIKLIYNKHHKTKTFAIQSSLTGLVILLPIVFSLIRYYNYSETNKPVNITIVQPNNDPYSEQYELPPAVILKNILHLADSVSDAKTDFVLAPESAIQEHSLFERDLDKSNSVHRLKNYIEKNPNTAIVIGASTYYVFDKEEALPLSARKFQNSERYYNAYNTAIYLDKDFKTQVYHKSKLTPAVEKMPFKKLFKNIESLAIDLGGTIGSLGTDKYRIPFTTKKGFKVAPVICYESIYGEFVSKFVYNGAELLFIITNDGWWGNTPGHKQHMQYARLRAIETRRSVARSANTGISAFINQRGDIISKTKYWEKDAINNTLNANNKKTFYVSHGDFISRVAVFISAFILLMSISSAIRNKKKL